MSGILRLENLNKGTTLKQGDKTVLSYRLSDADGEQLNIAGNTAVARLMHPDFTRIGYESEALTVSEDNIVQFSIDSIIPSRLYYLEITVDGQYIFPSRSDEGKLSIDRSSMGAEITIIENAGIDAVVRKAVELINEDPSLIIDEERLVNEIISNTGIKNIDEYYQQYSDVIKELSEEKDYHSLPEIAGARGGFDTLGERLEDTDAQLTKTMSQTEFDSWVATLLDGGPSIFMDSLVALQTTYPNGSVGVALVRETDPARIYVWDGNVWRDFGEYQGLEVKDKTITPEKTTFFKTINLFDKTKLTLGGFVNGGSVVSNSSYAHSDYIEVESGYYIMDGNPSSVADFYGNDRNYLSSFARYFIPQPYPDKTIIEVPAGVKLMRVNLFLGTHETVLKVNPDTFMVVRGNVYPSEYIPYSGKSQKIKPEHIDLRDIPLTDFPDSLAKYPVEPENMTIFNMGPFNLFNPQTATVGGFLNNGVFISNPEWGHSDYIEVESGKKYIKWGNVAAKGDFHDANGDFISNITAVERDDFIVISPPSGAKSMRVNFFRGTNPSITTTPLDRLMVVEGEVYPDDYIEYTDNKVPKIDVKYLPTTASPIVSNNVLDGKLLVTGGDSLTHGPGYIPWGKIIADRNNMDFENHGISGSTLADVEGRNPFVTRWQNMPDNIDYLIFWFGWNDQANTELGLPDSTDTSTFYGALNYILPALRNEYPTTKIGVMVPFLPLAKQEYADAVKERAQYFGIPLYDFNADYAPLLNQRLDVSPEMIQLARDTWTYDGLHFHQEGHEFLSTVIESFMLSL